MNNEFFSLPLFPQSSCAFESVDEMGGGSANGTGGNVYACPPAATNGRRQAVAQCSNCGTTCATGSGLCPRCGRAMTNIT